MALTTSFTEAKERAIRASSLPYPKALEVSPWWANYQRVNRERIRGYASVTDAMEQAQVGMRSGFDHRQFTAEAAQTVHFKLEEIQFRFPEYYLPNLPHESEFSLPESIVCCRWSSIFLTHLYFYLRIKAFQTPRCVLEIGSGYGGLARIFHIQRPSSTYVCVDLPESLFYADVFLSANFPDASILYVEDALPEDMWDYDFILVPAQLAGLLEGHQFDLVVNTGSLQEMAASAVDHWMNFIQNTIVTRAFYSWNYFLNDKTQFNEVAHASSLIVPILDPYWECRYFRINDPVLTIDADERNWLEVYVERIPVERRVHLNPAARVADLLEAAQSYRMGTNYWFKNMWMAIWVCPSPVPVLLKAMLQGIELFAQKKAPGILNNVESRSDFGETKYYEAQL